MVKFNLDFKIKIIAEYLSGRGSTTLAKRYSTASKATVLNWIHSFELCGIKGLERLKLF